MTRMGKRALSLCPIPLAVALLFSALGNTASLAAEQLVLDGAKIYPAPDAPAIERGRLVISDGQITAVGKQDEIGIPTGAEVVEVSGHTVTAGLWNAHVHFNVPPLESLKNGQVQSYVTDMLLQYGFVHVLDAGSAPGVAIEIRRRIEAGEMKGPNTFIAGGSLVPAGASPFYLRPNVLPDAPDPGDAQALVDSVFDFGMDGIKIFSGSITGFSGAGINVVPMKTVVVRGVTESAHARDMFVMAHPSNNEGAWAAVNGGVDILAHTFPQEGWDTSLPEAMATRNVALVPTLKLWRYEGERFEQTEAFIVASTRLAQEQLAAFAALGGQVLFGTDVGYMTDFDPTEEYVLMQEAGLNFTQILESLTTAPAKRFGLAARTGRLASGMDADLVVLPDDPASDITAFARPSLVMRKGKVVFERAP